MYKYFLFYCYVLFHLLSSLNQRYFHMNFICSQNYIVSNSVNINFFLEKLLVFKIYSYFLHFYLTSKRFYSGLAVDLCYRRDREGHIK